MSTPLFSKRHYEWLARWAGDNLSPEHTATLARDLRNTNHAFDYTRFVERAAHWRVAYRNARDFASAL